MAKPRHLTNAPIVEAIIDLKTRTWAELKLESFSDLDPELRELYPNKPDEIRLLEMAFKQEPGKPTASDHTDHGNIGLRFTSADGKYIFQARKDGFTFSRLSPYLDWETFFAEAARAFIHYCKVGRVEGVHRIAVRYVNRMLLPADEIGDFSGFLTAPPPFPREVPTFMTHFLTQVQVQEADSLLQATVTQTIQRGQPTPGFIPLILDIDAFQIGNLPLNPEVLLAQLTPLREFKNRLFFSSITEKMADLFS